MIVFSGSLLRLLGDWGLATVDADTPAAATWPDNSMSWVGGGAISSNASQALLKVAEHLQAPVVATPEGKGAISDKHYLSMGGLFMRNDVIGPASFGPDVILAVGTRLATPQLLDGQKVIQIDIDPEELGRNYSDTYGINADARQTMESIFI